MTFLVGHKVIMVVIGYAFHITISLYTYTLCLKHISMYLVLLPSANPQPISMQKSPNNTLSKSFIQSMYFSCAYHFIFVCSGLLCMYIRVALILKESYALSDTIFASIICHIIILCGTQKVDCCMYVCYSVGVLCCSIEYPQAGCIDFCIHHIYRHNVIICPE